MTQQSIGLGTAANDGTGDTLRAAGQKINANFSEVYNKCAVLDGQVTVLQDAMLIATASLVATTSIPTGTDSIRTSGYAAVGDGGGALYKKVVAQPAHPGKLQSLDGAWWELTEARGNIRMFGADPTGTANTTTIINNTMAYCMAFTPYKPMYIPSGKYRVNTTPTEIPSWFVIEGDGEGLSTLVPYMTDGTACLKFVSGSGFFVLRDFGIATTMSFTTFRTGTAAPNCIGLHGGDVSTGHATRYRIDNVYVYGCGTGAHMDGWIATIDKLHIEACEYGFKGLELNGVRLNLHLENCRKSYSIDDSFALQIDNLQDEGDITGKLVSTMDNCGGVHMVSPYFEASVTYPQSVPYLTIGGTHQCWDICLTGGYMESINLTRDAPCIKLDNVNGAVIDTFISMGSVAPGAGLTIETTANTYNVKTRHYSAPGVTNYHDNSRVPDRAINYFPNPNFSVWLRGWNAIVLNNCTMARELYTTRRGRNSVKITATAASANNYIQFDITDSKQLTECMNGITFRVGAWFYIPDIAEYSAASPTAIPDVSMIWDTGAATGESTTTATSTIRVGDWVFRYANLTLNAATTKLSVRVWLNRSATNASGNEYLYISSISIVDYRVSVERQMEGHWDDSEFIPKFIGGRMIANGTAAPTDVNQTYNRGDEIINAAADRLTSYGLHCTNAGAGGTASWYPLPGTYASATVATLPALAGTFAGAWAFATDGRSGAEGAGAGTGCWCYLNSAGAWLACWSGAAVAA